jgi:hypothetical protein
MTRRTRQLTAFPLAIALTFSMLPSAVWAADSAESEPTVAAAETMTGSESEEPADSESAGTVQPLTAETTQETAAATPTQIAKASTAAQQDGGTSSSADNQVATFGALVTSALSDPNVTLSTADEVQDGQIRYITQQKKNPYYQSEHWGTYYALNYCWAACISMSLSYLGIDQLPKDILSKSNSESKSPTLNRGAVYRDDVSLEEAVDDYVNGNGAYSPPVITWTSDCYSTGQHILMIIGKKSKNVYEVIDPLENSASKNFIREITVNGTTAKSTKLSTGKTVYTFKITRVYQYVRKVSTTLENGRLTLDGGVLKEKTPLTVQGHIGGYDHISTVTAGCYDLDGNPVKDCNKTEAVNSVGYDLSEMNKSLQFSKLTPGFYEYRVTVKMADGTSNVLLRQKFAVRNAQKNLPNATFYFDNGKSIKYCVTAEDSKSGSVPVLSYNTESDAMKIRAQAVGVNGYYRLMVEESGLYLTVYKSSAASGTKVIQYPKADKAGQYWQILPGPKDGYYYLMPKCAPTCCLSVAKDAVETGGSLEIRTAKASAAQSWLLRYTRPLISNVRNVTSGVQVTWDVPAYATGYQIYRAAGSSSTWKQVKHVTNGKTASWVDTKVTNGVKYRYKVKALYGSAASPLTPEGHRYRVVRPASLHVKSTKTRKLTATWSANTKATGYQLCYATNKSFAGSKTLTINGAHNKTKTISGLVRGKKYYVKVRAWKKVGQNNYFSAWTAVKQVHVK